MTGLPSLYLNREFSGSFHMTGQNLLQKILEMSLEEVSNGFNSLVRSLRFRWNIQDKFYFRTPGDGFPKNENEEIPSGQDVSVPDSLQVSTLVPSRLTGFRADEVKFVPSPSFGARIDAAHGKRKTQSEFSAE